jgi:hypothetical protein
MWPIILRSPHDDGSPLMATADGLAAAAVRSFFSCNSSNKSESCWATLAFNSVTSDSKFFTISFISIYCQIETFGHYLNNKEQNDNNNKIIKNENENKIIIATYFNKSG